jgi:hypothetical protein
MTAYSSVEVEEELSGESAGGAEAPAAQTLPGAQATMAAPPVQ